MGIASPEAISAALEIIEKQPQPKFTLLPSSETDEIDSWVLKWSGPYAFQLVYLRCGSSHALLATGPRAWVSLDEIRLYTPGIEEPEPIGTGGRFCIDLNPLSGLTDAFNAALAVPLNI